MRKRNTSPKSRGCRVLKSKWRRLLNLTTRMRTASARWLSGLVALRVLIDTKKCLIIIQCESSTTSKGVGQKPRSLMLSESMFRTLTPSFVTERWSSLPWDQVSQALKWHLCRRCAKNPRPSLLILRNLPPQVQLTLHLQRLVKWKCMFILEEIVPLIGQVKTSLNCWMARCLQFLNFRWRAPSHTTIKRFLKL